MTSASDTPRTLWVAVSYGSLDVRDHPIGAGSHEVIVVPVHPGSPLFLYGEGADLWRRLVGDGLDDAELSEHERDIAEEMEEMGIVARDPAHAARVDEIRPPWLTSPMHELVYALLSSVAAAEGIDIVFIKGPTLHAQGLRDRAHSGDVDCWVPVADERRFAIAMQRWGWTPAFSAFTGTRVLHSLTLRASEWGSAVDVHTWFPGMAMEPDDAFSLVQVRSELREFAGRPVRTPIPALHAVVSALHDVRPLQGRGPGTEQLARAAETLRRGGTAVMELAHEAHAGYALADPLRLAYPDAEFDAEGATVPIDWAWRLQDTTLGSYKEAIKLIPLRDRPRVIFRILWPTAESLRGGPTADGVASIGRTRFRRAVQGWHLLRGRKRARR
jgi:hypothetical protein